METKYCPRCGKTKLKTEFYRAKDRISGLRSYCKSCSSNLNKTYLKNYQKTRYAEDKAFREMHKKQSLDFGRSRPETGIARRIVRKAIIEGRLKREPCIICGVSKTEGHHKDYRKPLEVVWLCGTHHKLANLGRLTV